MSRCSSVREDVPAASISLNFECFFHRASEEERLAGFQVCGRRFCKRLPRTVVEAHNFSVDNLQRLASNRKCDVVPLDVFSLLAKTIGVVYFDVVGCACRTTSLFRGREPKVRHVELEAIVLADILYAVSGDGIGVVKLTM
jgi:hypothetical protein